MSASVGFGDHASLVARLTALPDRWLFGARAQAPGLSGRLRRLARYPYALVRDLACGRLTLHATGLVYATLLALIPLIAFSFGILKAFNAQGVLEPLVYNFFSPMGDGADTLTRRVMLFANKVRGGLVGSVGFAALVWTLIGTMKKVEDSFNFVWHVDQARGLARRTAEYSALLILGPVLLAVVFGFSRLALESAPLKLLSQLPWIDRGMAVALRLAPYVTVSAVLTVLYVVVPNTQVRIRPALAGGIAAGVLWAAVGRVFSVFVLNSSRLLLVYAGFAIIIAALIWTYLGWIILLLGAQLSFYVQNPSYLRRGLRDLMLSCADIERLSLSIVYRIAEQRTAGAAPMTAAALARALDVPGVEVTRRCATLEAHGLLHRAADETLELARDPGQVLVGDILAAARAGDATETTAAVPAPVRALSADLDAALLERCGTLTLEALLRGSLPGDSHRLQQQ